MRLVRFLEGFPVLWLPNVSKKFIAVLPTPRVVLASESSSLGTWGMFVEWLPMEAKHEQNDNPDL